MLIFVICILLSAWFGVGFLVGKAVTERQIEKRKNPRVGNLMVNPNLDEGVYMVFNTDIHNLKDKEIVEVEVNYWLAK